MKNELKRGRKPKKKEDKAVPVSISEYITKSDKTLLIESGGRFLELKMDLKTRLRKGINQILKK